MWRVEPSDRRPLRVVAGVAQWGALPLGSGLPSAASAWGRRGWELAATRTSTAEWGAESSAAECLPP